MQFYAPKIRERVIRFFRAPDNISMKMNYLLPSQYECYGVLWYWFFFNYHHYQQPEEVHF